eukprot:TRINITY_DN5031_c0_g1_i13.p1 TRINITY_DN5031_c0_g1~~TRINITY_DN5031_c0_g1_i13.p1  ORF type:complete len:283 (-),score=66.29 TRINITY_DN5031_c0_g1_i13:109-957(-)
MMGRKRESSSVTISDSPFKIFSEIHKSDSNMIDNEVKCLQALIKNSARIKAIEGKNIELNDVTDAKSLIARYIDTFNPHNNSLSSLDLPGKVRIKYMKPRYALNLKAPENEPIPYKVKDVASLKQLNGSAVLSHNHTLSQSISPYSRNPFNSYKRRAQHKTIHKYIKELDNIICFDDNYNTKEDYNKVSKEFSMDVKRRLEEYKLERQRQRREVLNSIDTEKIKMIKPLYQYKMQSFINYDKDSIEFREKLSVLLMRSQRILARRGKGIMTRQKIRAHIYSK